MRLVPSIDRSGAVLPATATIGSAPGGESVCLAIDSSGVKDICAPGFVQLMLRDDDRGQSIQIGAILLFGVLVIGLAVTQTVVVPAENGGVEFNSYTEATTDLVRLQQGVLAAGTGGGYASATVRTGVRYPSRAVLINPGPPTGSLTTTPATNVSIDGVEAVSGEEDNVRGFWNTSTRGARNYSTRSVVFSPAYNEIDVPPVEISGQGAYRRTANGPLALTGGTFLSGNRITLVTVDGDLGASGLSTPVTATPASVSTRSVTVTGSESEFVVTLPVPGNGTAAAATAWNRSRAAESLRSNPHVLDTETNGSRVDVTFDGDRRYELRLARVVVHDSGDSGIDPDTDPQYVVAVEGNGTQVPTTGTRRVAVEVRDRYNNPVEGVAVSFSTAGGNFTTTRAGTATVVTGGEGVAAVTVDPNQSSVSIDASFDAGVAPYNATTVVLTEPAGGGGGIDEINQGVNGVTLGGSQASGNSKTEANVTFSNDATADEITAVRVAFHSPDDTSNDAGPATTVTVEGETFGVGERQEFSPSFELAADSDFILFDFSLPTSGQDIEGDFFIVTLEFDSGSKATYFVSVDT